MDPRSPTNGETPTVFHCCEWPDCGCPAGTIRDDCPGKYDPRNMVIIEGEHLELERLAANRGCIFTPWESFFAVGVTLAVIVIGLWAWNAAQGVPV